MHLHTAQTQVVDDAAAQPLIRPDTEDVVAAGVQVRLQAGQQAAREQVAVAAVAVAWPLVAADELLGTAHVQVLAGTQVSHQLHDTLGLRVRVVLRQVEPIVVVAMVLVQVTHRLVHQPHGPVIAMGDHRHAVRRLGTAQAREEESPVEVVRHRAVHRYAQRVQSGTRRQDAHKEALSDAQLCVDVARPVPKREAQT